MSKWKLLALEFLFEVLTKIVAKVKTKVDEQPKDVV